MKNHPYSINLSKVCRLCFIEKTGLSSIFDNTSIPDLPLKIKQCVSVEISNNDQLPDQICDDCFKEINNWVKFKQRCNEADADLKDYVRNVQVKEESGEDIESEKSEKYSSPCIQTTDVLNNRTDPDDAIDISIELDSTDDLVNNEKINSPDQSNIYSCKICNETFTSCDILFNHKLNCYMHQDESGNVADTDENLETIADEYEVDSLNVSFDNTKATDELPLRICEIDNETSAHSVDKAEADADQEMISRSVNDVLPSCVCEVGNETSTPHEASVDQEEISENDGLALRICEAADETSIPNDPVDKTGTDQGDVSMNEELPLRICEEANETSTANDPLDEASTDQDDISMNEELPLRICESANDTSTANDQLDEASTDQDDISMNNELPLRICEEANETSTPNDLIDETASDQENISMNYGLPLRICEVNYGTSFPNYSINKTDPLQEDFPCSMNYDFHSDNNQIDSKIDIVKIKNLNESITEETCSIDQSPLRTDEINDQISTLLDQVDSDRENDPHTMNNNLSSENVIDTIETQCNSSKIDHSSHNTNGNGIHSNDDFDIVEDFEEISIEIDLDATSSYKPENQNKTSHFRKRYSSEKPFQCDKCGRNFSCKRGLIIHNGKDSCLTFKGSYKCKKCDYRGFHIHNLKYHMITQHEQGPFTCETCGKTCSHRVSLQRHRREVHRGKRRIFTKFRFTRPAPVDELICDYCKKCFRLKTHLKEHILNHIHIHKCDECGRLFPTKTGLHLHKRTHSSICLLKCEKCDFTAKIRQSINNHMLREHGIEGSVICKTCGESFKNQPSLLEHRKLAHSGEPSKYCIRYEHAAPEEHFDCKLCDKSYKSKLLLRQHHRHVHDESAKRFTCEICDYRTVSRSILKTHFRGHIGEKSYTCDICNKSFIHKHSWQFHMRKHKDVGQFICDPCQQRFKTKAALREHIVSSHVFIFQCDKCPKRYSSETDFHFHRSTHNSDGKLVLAKKFICEVCGKACATSSHLTLHQRTHNSNRPPRQKLFTCEICNYKCTDPDDLTDHFRFHTGEKPFACDKCDERFPSKKSLNKHNNCDHTPSVVIPPTIIDTITLD